MIYSSAPPAKKTVMLREDGLNRLRTILGALNSDLQTLSALLVDAEERRAVNKQIPAHLIRRIEEVVSDLRDTWPERKSRINSSVEQLIYYFGEARPDEFVN